MSAELPLIARFPELARVPRVALGVHASPVGRLASIAPDLWVKRDDLSADPLGGNKVRALEFLLGGVRAGDTVVTVGAAGSTHALAVARCAARLGATTLVGRWRQEMNDTAAIVARQVGRAAREAPILRSPVGAYVWAARRRAGGAHWIAAGGTTPLGILGHVNAALELAEQVGGGVLPMPRRVVVPLGTGGTAAGLILGFAIAGLPVPVVGTRVVPWIVGRAARVHSLANRTASLIERVTGHGVPRPGRDALSVWHGSYGGAYGRETPDGRDATVRMHDAGGIRLDPTYSAKAFSNALVLAKDRPTLFWLTFDSRTLEDHDPTA